MKPETKAFIDACEERANKATPGPWHDTRYHEDDLGPHIENDEEETVAYCGLNVPEHSDNGPFIANARADVPELIRIIREQGAEMARMQRTIDAQKVVISGLIAGAVHDAT